MQNSVSGKNLLACDGNFDLVSVYDDFDSDLVSPFSGGFCD